MNAEAGTYPVKHTGYFTRPEFWALDEACKPLRETFPDYGPYLVGSVMERPTYRDVDVRLILPDERYDRLDDAEWGLLGFIVSRHLAAVTGLPIDFQFQRQTEANGAYSGKQRNPLGVRGFEHHWVGDQRPAVRCATCGRADECDPQSVACHASSEIPTPPADDAPEFVPEFVCEGCGARAVDDGGDALLGWTRDESGDLAFCGACSSESPTSPASDGGA